MVHTTFRKAHEAGACSKSYKRMAEALGGVKSYGEDTPIGLDKILEVCGLDDALWVLRITIEPIEREARLFACACAERVLPLFEAKYPDDKRPRQAIEVAKRFAVGEATSEELAAAAAAARAAGAAAADAARAAADAAWSAARAAAADAARAAAADAARAAADAAWDASWSAAADAARAAGEAADAARAAGAAAADAARAAADAAWDAGEAARAAAADAAWAAGEAARAAWDAAAAAARATETKWQRETLLSLIKGD